MADKEDSLRIKIKIDVAEEDKEFVAQLSSDLERADQAGLKTTRKKQEKLGPPTKTEFEIRELEEQIKIIDKRRKKKKEKKTSQQILAEKKQQLLTKQFKEFKEGPVGKINKLSTHAVSNLMTMATRPGDFLAMAFGKILGRYGMVAARGGLYAIIALIVYEIVMFAIKQLMQPGRWLDRRYRRVAREETMNFYERTIQEELRHGYLEMRVTTIHGLRGGESQVNGNLYEFSSAATGILQASPYRSSQQIYGHAYLSGSGIDKRGNPRRRTVSGRFS
ncbi:MAG: hypothetical protein O6761_08735 [Thaumarchaeota archaeon]|nr:hypothetical protein [Nitrososphaerota archaeon]